MMLRRNYEKKIASLKVGAEAMQKEQIVIMRDGAKQFIIDSSHHVVKIV